MTIYVVLIDAGRDQNDIAEQWDHIPSEREEQELNQTIGYHYGGWYETSTPEEAIARACDDFDGGGCVA